MSKNSNNFIRNVVLILDFVIANVVLTCYFYYIARSNPAKLEGVSLPFLLLFANGSMIFAQLFFSNIVHGHYMAIDKVLRQICFLSLLYGVLFFCGLESSKYIFGTLTPNAGFTMWCIGISVAALVLMRIVEYLLLKQFRRYGRNARIILFVGKPEQLIEAYDDINIMSHAGLRVSGYYSDEQIPEDSHVSMKYLGTLNDLKDRLSTDTKRIADDIYCTELPGDDEFISQLVDYSMRNAIQFNYVPPFFTNFGYCLKPRVEGELVVFSNLNEPLQSLGNRMVKRGFDLLVSSVALIFLLPFIPIIGLIIKVSSPGPIFFKQKRTGLNGEDFYMLKFRSMHVNKDADKLQATKDDPRKFAFGSFMRKTNIDELPQIFNVFKGDMSIVGPRPHMLAHTDEYRKKIYEYMLRHLVRPGITGWAQVTGFRGETPELWQMEGRVQRDLWYIQNWSFWLDIRIIFRTALLTIIHDKNAF